MHIQTSTKSFKQKFFKGASQINGGYISDSEHWDLHFCSMYYGNQSQGLKSSFASLEQQLNVIIFLAIND